VVQSEPVVQCWEMSARESDASPQDSDDKCQALRDEERHQFVQGQECVD